MKKATENYAMIRKKSYRKLQQLEEKVVVYDMVRSSGDRISEHPKTGKDRKKDSHLNNKSCSSAMDYMHDLGYRWGRSESHYWLLWTLWEPQTFQNLLCLSELPHDVTFHWRQDAFNDLINEGFSKVSEDPAFRPLEVGMRTVVVRADFGDQEEPFQVNTETIRIEASEIAFNNGTVSLRFLPIQVLACAGLAEVLRGICKKTDILIISGTFKRVDRTSTKERLLLLNFENVQGTLQIIRTTFQDDPGIKMLEKITPTYQDGRFQFKYFATSKDGKSRRELVRHRNFKWVKNSREFYQNQEWSPVGSYQDFAVPIQHGMDAYEVYKVLLSEGFHLNTPTPAPALPLRESTSVQRSDTLRRKLPIDIRTDSEASSEDNSPSRETNNNNHQSQSQSSINQLRYSKDSLVFHSGLHNFSREGSWASNLRNKSSSRQNEPNENFASSFFKSFCQLGVNFGKIFVLLFMTLLVLAFANMIFNPTPCCEFRKQGNSLDDESEMNSFNANGGSQGGESNQHGQFNIGQSVGQFINKLGDVVGFVMKWIEEHCGFECVMRRFWSTDSANNPPVV